MVFSHKFYTAATLCFFIASCGQESSFLNNKDIAEKAFDKEKEGAQPVTSDVVVKLPTLEEAPGKDEGPKPAVVENQEPTLPSQPVQKPEEEKAPELSEEEVLDTFITSTVQTPVDVVWAIDNSGSMAGEVENVRKNFSFFLDSVKGLQDVKVGLISANKKQSKYGLNLDEKQKSQVDLWVSHPKNPSHNLDVASTNALAMIASTSCDANSSSKAENKICDLNVNEEALKHPSKNKSISDKSDVYGSAGFLSDFYRQESQKVMVVVTDDSATGFYSDGYLQAMNGLFGEGNHRLYHFSFLEGQGAIKGCHPGTAGKEKDVYKKLSEATFGEGYSICEENWTAHFEKLVKSIESVATREFKSEHKCSKLVSVSIDGEKLSSDQFTFNLPSTLVIAEGVLKTQEQKIEMICKIKK